MQFSGKIGQTIGVLTPPLGKSWNRPCFWVINMVFPHSLLTTPVILSNTNKDKQSCVKSSSAVRSSHFPSVSKLLIVLALHLTHEELAAPASPGNYQRVHIQIRNQIVKSNQWLPMWDCSLNPSSAPIKTSLFRKSIIVGVSYLKINCSPTPQSPPPQ